MNEHYQRRLLLIASNLVFSHCDGLFKTLMATAAAIGRPVHDGGDHRDRARECVR